MNAAEVRGLLLQKYYERRREGLVKLEPGDFGETLSQEDIQLASGQLAEQGLILWRLRENVAGMGQITADGINVVEGGSESPIPIRLAGADQGTRVSRVTGKPIGSRIDPTITVYCLQALARAIDESSASTPQKRDAKSRLKHFLEHPVVAPIVGVAASAIIDP